MDRRFAEARRLERAGQSLPALEQWSLLTGAKLVSVRTEAVLGQARTLRQLNEEFLAEQMLRGTFLYDPDPVVREQAFAQLQRDYEATADEDSVLTLVGAAAMRQPEPNRLRQLASVLLDQGDPGLALPVLLALPPAEQSPPLVARAAYQLGWWQVFEETLSRWPDSAQRRLWEGYRAQQRGDYREALRLWREAGAVGRESAEALETGLAIRDRLRDSDPAVRERAVADWARWQTRQPGVHVWRDASHLLDDYAGAVKLFRQARGLHLPTRLDNGPGTGGRLCALRAVQAMPRPGAVGAS